MKNLWIACKYPLNHLSLQQKAYLKGKNMVTLELKQSLLQTIEGIDDVSIINQLSNYAKRLLRKKSNLSKADLMIDPAVNAIVKDIKGGRDCDDKMLYHQYLEEKYK